jgi:hypothetical protein
MEEPVHVHFGICAVFHVWTRYLASARLVCTDRKYYRLPSVQVKRLKWKNELVQNADEKLSRDGIPLPNRIKYVLDLTSNAGFQPTSFVFRLGGLTCTGDFSFKEYLNPEVYSHRL